MGTDIPSHCTTFEPILFALEYFVGYDMHVQLIMYHFFVSLLLAWLSFDFGYSPYSDIFAIMVLYLTLQRYRDGN